MFKEFLSLFNPKNLPTVDKTFWRGAFYVFLACVIFVIFSIGSIFFVLQKEFGTISPAGSINKFADDLVSSYPEGLVLNLSRDGEFTKNIPGPIALGTIPKSPNEESDIANLIVLDDSVSASVESLQNSKAFLLVAKDGLIGVSDENGRIQGFSFKEILSEQTAEEASNFKGLDLDKSKLVELKNDFVPVILSFIWIILIAGIFIMLLILPIVHIIWTLLVAIIVLAIFAFTQRKMQFEESYLTALYASVPAIVASSMVAIFVSMPLSQTILTVVWVALGYFVFNKKII